MEQAKSWAEKKTLKLESGKPVVSTFDFDEEKVSKLKIKEFTNPCEEWFDYVVKNRKELLNDDDYDIVIGPVANDGTYEVINLYLRRILSMKYY